MGQQAVGFGAQPKDKRKFNQDELFAMVEAEDLTKFGLIPEFIGRVPVIATLDQLDEKALVDILTRPRNALTRQYQRLFELDGVQLKFTEKSLELVAREALKRKAGARGLRAIDGLTTAKPTATA
jgi:ATP-dependent Clp protease ATP-binding subunit ClpX